MIDGIFVNSYGRHHSFVRLTAAGDAWGPFGVEGRTLDAIVRAVLTWLASDTPTVERHDYVLVGDEVQIANSRWSGVVEGDDLRLAGHPYTRLPWPAPVDVNTASAEQLAVIPGFGPASVAKVVAHRASVGPFSNVDELAKIGGLNRPALAKARLWVSVRAAT